MSYEKRIVIFCLFFGFCFANGQPHSAHRISVDRNWFSPNGIILRDNNHLLIYGSSIGYKDSPGTMIELDSSEKIISVKHLENYYSFISYNGNYFAVKLNDFMRPNFCEFDAFDDNWNPLIERQYHLGSTTRIHIFSATVADLIKCSDNGFLVAIKTNGEGDQHDLLNGGPEDGMLYKLNSNGDSLWRITHDGNARDVYFETLPNVFRSLKITWKNSEKLEVIFNEIDTINGYVKSNKLFSCSGTAIGPTVGVKTLKNELIMISSIRDAEQKFLVVRTDFKGNLISNQAIHYRRLALVTSVIATSDSGFAVLSRTGVESNDRASFNQYDSRITKFSSAGETEWAEDYSAGEPISFIQKQNGGYAVISRQYIRDEFHKEKIFLTITDARGKPK